MTAEQILDKTCPDWFVRVDLKKLSLTDPDNCIIGQLEEDFPLLTKMKYWPEFLIQNEPYWLERIRGYHLAFGVC